jgi:predicted PurR-regulated permease PerM
LPFMIYYMSIDFSKIMRFFGRLSSHEKYQRVLRDLDQIFFLYFTGQSLVCVSLMLAYTLLLHLIGIKYALMLGILVGLLSFIPYVGFMIGFFLVTLIAFAQHDPSWALLGRIIAVFFSLGIIETQILSPRIIGKRLGVPPLVFILAIVVVNYYFGLLGMFLAYPITATLIKLWTERWQPKKVVA